MINSKNESLIILAASLYVSGTPSSPHGVPFIFHFFIFFLRHAPVFLISVLFHRHTIVKVTTSFDKGPQETLFTSLVKAR